MCGHATVHSERLTGDKRGFIRRQEQHRIGNFFRLPHAAEWMSCALETAEFVGSIAA